MTKPRAVNPTSDVEEELRRLADAASQRATTELPRSLRRPADSLLARVRRSRSHAEALMVVEETGREVARFADLVDHLQAQLARLQQEQFAVEPFGAAWRDLVSAEIRGAADRAAPVWVRRYAQAFVAGEFDVCVWLSGGAGGDPVADGGGGGPLLADRDLSRRMLLSARAAQDQNLAASLPALETLTDSEHASALPPELSFRAWCMRIRAVARGAADAARARDLAKVAIERAKADRPAVPAEVLAALYAAHGECLIELGDLDGATSAADLALRTAPREPAPHVLRGLVAEYVEDFTGADESYENAADADGARSISGELYAPVPPNLLWQHARRLRRTDPRRAVRLIRQALASGIRGSGPYPDRKAYVDLAHALERRRETDADSLRERLRTEAAEAYWEAGRRYAWVGDEVSANRYLSRACALDPTRPRYAFERAEVLRIRAVHEDGTVDLDLLRKAADGWQQAYELGVPGAELPWAYVTRALIVHEESGDLYRPRASWLAVALLEQGLLCDPDNVRTMAQLSQAHRLLGNRWTALDLIERASRRDSADELVFDQRLLALLEVERSAEALDLIEVHGLRADQPWLVIRKVQLLLTLDRAADALSVLQTVRPLDQALNDLYLGVCYELLQDEEAAREAYEQVAAGAGSAGPEGRSDLSAWAGYLLGRYDDAERAYTELIRRDPDDPSLRCDLGQILLARGDETRGDIGAGRDLLRAGIEATCSLWSLTTLERIDLPRLFGRVLQDPAAPVRSAVEEIRAALRDRERTLRLAADPVAELEPYPAEVDRQPQTWRAAVLALARVQLSRGTVAAALDGYVELAREGVPEAGLGLGLAGDRLRRSADELADRRESGAALDTYRRLLSALERSPEPLPALAAAAHLRAALVALELRRTGDFERHAVQAFPEDSSVEREPAVQEALAAVFVRPARYWQVMDAARRLGSGQQGTELPASAAAAGAARRLLGALDAAALLRARQDDVGAAALFPLAAPLTIQLGPGLLGDQHAGARLRTLLEEMGRRVEQDTGVPIPGIGLQPLRDNADPGSYLVELYENEIVRGTVPTGGHFVLAEQPAGGPRSPAAPTAETPQLPVVDPLTQQSGRWSGEAADPVGSQRSWTAEQFVVRHLETVIRTHLPRLFDIDDVGIWLSSMRSGREATAGIDRLGLADRLELLRLLRLLLREQVSIVDAGAIFRVVHEAGPEWSALDLLPAVRARLRPRLAPTAVRSARPALLPAELEAAFAAGFSAADTPSWQLPRSEAAALAERVLAWYRSEPRDGPVVIRDAELRPFFWRLLAVLVPGPVWVLSEEETDGLD